MGPCVHASVVPCVPYVSNVLVPFVLCLHTAEPLKHPLSHSAHVSHAPTLQFFAIGFSQTEGAGAEKGGAGTLQLTKSLWEQQQSTFQMGGATLQWELSRVVMGGSPITRSTSNRSPFLSHPFCNPFSSHPFCILFALPLYYGAKCSLASSSLFIQGIRLEREKLLLSVLTQASPC